MNQVLSFLNSIPSDAWSILVEIVVSALLVSPLMMAIRKWFDIDGEKKMVALVIAGSIIAGAVDYLHGIPVFAPWFAIVQGWLVFATTQPVYHFFLKPVAAKSTAWFAVRVENALAIQGQTHAAAVPPEGLPVIAATQPVVDTDTYTH